MVGLKEKLYNKGKKIHFESEVLRTRAIKLSRDLAYNVISVFKTNVLFLSFFCPSVSASFFLRKHFPLHPESGLFLFIQRFSII